MKEEDYKKNELIRKKAAVISLIVGSSMFIFQGIGYYYTNSTTILSNAIESLVHIAAIGFVVYSVYYSSKPPDEEHPFGHGKIENFSIGFEGGLIFIAGISIIIEAIRHYFSGQEVVNLDIGMVVIGIVIFINLCLSYYLHRVGTRVKSEILLAESKHELSDALASLGSLIGLIAIWLTEIKELDIIVAILVAIHLLYTGAKLLHDAFKKLMDQADPKLLNQITDTLNNIRKPEWYDIHNLKVMTNGDMVYIEFHMVIPSDWTIVQAHNAMDMIENKLLKSLGSRGSVMIHPDPNERSIVDKLLFEEQKLSEPFTVKRITRYVPDVHDENL
jgi:cation diffusion facilitator family transporter